MNSEGGFEERYFEDPEFPAGLKGGDEVRGYGYYPDYFPVVEAQLATLIEMTGGGALLDVGCGKGALAAYARRDLGVRVVGADASAYAVGCARGVLGAGAVVRADCARLPFGDTSFDLIWCNGVLQYQEGAAARAALAEIARVARRAAFVSNIAAAERHSEWGQHDRLTRLYLRPGQWAALAAGELPEGGGWRVVGLPFEGEAAMLLYRRVEAEEGWAARYVSLTLERMRRLGVLEREPPGLAGWQRRLERRERRL